MSTVTPETGLSLALAVPESRLAHSGLLAEASVFVVFSLATDILYNINPNIHVKEALKGLKPKKYLGLILSESSFSAPGVGLIQHVRLVGVGACAPQVDYARRGPYPSASWLYSPHFLALDGSSVVPDIDRPVLHPEPRLPWKDCVVYTIEARECEVGRLHTSDDLIQVPPCDLYAVETWIHKGLKNREQIREAWQEGRLYVDQDTSSNPSDSPVSREVLNFPEEIDAEVSRQLGRHRAGYNEALENRLQREYGKRPDRRIIVHLSEDLSELSHVPYPGDFEEECDQLYHLMNLAWERLPYNNVLTKWPIREQQEGEGTPGLRILDLVDSASPSTSQRSPSLSSRHSFLPEALVPLPESPRFEEEADNDVSEVSRDLQMDNVHDDMLGDYNTMARNGHDGQLHIGRPLSRQKGSSLRDGSVASKDVRGTVDVGDGLKSELPRKRGARVRRAGARSAKKAASFATKATHAVRRGAVLLAQATGRCTCLVVQEFVRCIVDPC